MERLQNGYTLLLSSQFRMSIIDRLNFTGFRLQDYCKSFNPHPYAVPLAMSAKSFLQDYDAWLEQGQHYITCALYLFPDSPLHRILPIVENCGIDFYLNDTVGRTIYPFLSPAEQLRADQLVRRMSRLDWQLRLPKNAERIEIANQTVLYDIKRSSTEDWFSNFLHLYNLHLRLAHKNCNTNASKHLISVEEYETERCHISGMPHTVACLEFSTGEFLSQELMTRIGIDKMIGDLHWAVSLFGCLLNDIFSFELECIDSASDSNLLAVLALNHPALSMEEILINGCSIVRSYLKKSLDLIETIRSTCMLQLRNDTENLKIINNHLAGIERGIQACYIWQVTTKRYKRQHSIFEETTLPVELIHS